MLLKAVRRPRQILVQVRLTPHRIEIIRHTRLRHTVCGDVLFMFCCVQILSSL